MKLPSDILVGQYLQFFTLIVAASIAFVYTCGYTFGLFVHSLNNTCTQFFKEMRLLITFVTKMRLSMLPGVSLN
ncbi:hypothetical protein S-CBP4_0007 [Synechococcus phage S-CBP4]|uniref:Uncharacterized protein n=1 Tax=Synechococcus phage S-CBP4 TaxID=754059 RepID=A0A096VKN1_9CAUD|nr:hypothetical protein S-CBP4_0007 [Synechococcus phage S-CBP4]AGK86616.1 hypothetical protein S-CBP4_0007 [Synechococcus phage S-CBP4]